LDAFKPRLGFFHLGLNRLCSFLRCFDHFFHRFHACELLASGMTLSVSSSNNSASGKASNAAFTIGDSKMACVAASWSNCICSAMLGFASPFPSLMVQTAPVVPFNTSVIFLISDAAIGRAD